MIVNSPICDFGWKAEKFELLSVDDNYYSLDSLIGSNGTVVVFICNHCPYVKAIADRLSDEATALKDIGVNTIAIMSNDVNIYPEDSFENMKKFSYHHNFHFQYLYDKTQIVAKKYKAECTPDFYGFNNDLELNYRGRIDSGTMNNKNSYIERELFNAMKLISETNKGPNIQHNSFGCSIKWIKNG